MKTNRIATIDVFRAVTMFLMLFVNDIPGLKQIPHWMLHAQMDEDMLSCSDTIFHASCLCSAFLCAGVSGLCRSLLFSLVVWIAGALMKVNVRLKI